MTITFNRYVALGDSFTEGLDDPHPRGGYRGWADRLAEHIAAVNPEFQYANLAIRGRKIAQVHEEQLEPALAMRPDLASVMAGTNDVLRRHVSLDDVISHMEQMQRALIEHGATVVTFVLPDVSTVIPLAKVVRERLGAFNAAMRDLATRTGATLVDMESDPNTTHPSVWSEDRLHANSLGHQRIASAVAEQLGVPIPPEARNQPLPPPTGRPRHQTIAAELAWLRIHIAPWILRRLRGRSSGDGVFPKRPHMAPIVPLTLDRG